jgi:hypothetical protein
VDLRAVLRGLAEELGRGQVPHALIGGLGMAAHGVVRATQDIDLLVAGEAMERVDRIMRQRGYQLLFASENVANYASADPAKGRVDFLFARRDATRAMLERARPCSVLGGLELRAVESADLIGLKVQSSSNDPRRRALDLADIARLLPVVPPADLGRVREYFRLFDREPELDALLAELAAEGS